MDAPIERTQLPNHIDLHETFTKMDTIQGAIKPSIPSPSARAPESTSKPLDTTYEGDKAVSAPATALRTKLSPALAQPVTPDTVSSMRRIRDQLASTLAAEFPWMEKVALKQILASVNRRIVKQ